MNQKILACLVCFIVGGVVVPGVRNIVGHAESSGTGVRAVVPVTA